MNGLDCQHISSNLANYEAARSGFFTLVVNDIDNLVKASYSGLKENAQDTDKYKNGQEVLKLNVTNFPIPHFTVATSSYKRGNEEVKFATTPSFSGGNFSVDDIVGLDTKSLLMAWQNLVYDVHTRRGGRMYEYKKDAILYEYTQDFEQIRYWKIYGMFITDLSEQDLDKENDGPRKIQASFVYDRAEMYLPD